jgi:dockerin type I repeat protein
MPGSLRVCIGVVFFLAAFARNDSFAIAQSVWSGFDDSFSKADFADPTLATNQDRITSNVWLTRNVNQGIFNIHDEAGYTAAGSPAGTQWATGLNNPGKMIAATNWNNLTFTDWVTAYGGQGTAGLPDNLLGFNAVVHLLDDNTYLDLQFTAWSMGGGGGFSYNRAAMPPPPTATGDYNHNGVVDAADYVLWRNTLGQSASPAGSGADGNGNGTIDADDYSFWRSKFGSVAPGSGSGNELINTEVPEPAMNTLLLFGLVLSLLLVRKSRQSWAHARASRKTL